MTVVLSSVNNFQLYSIKALLVEKGSTILKLMTLKGSGTAFKKECENIENLISA